MTAIPWEKLARACVHELQVAIVVALAEADLPMSPKDLSDYLGEHLHNTSYHMRKLQDRGLVALVGERQVRGAVEHFYELV